ncbi:MAG: ATPase [Bacteroidota bacterium]
MDTPFIFGKIASSFNFTDRDKETALLISNFTSLINTIVISPRRWGKSSLVSKAAGLAIAENNKLKICQIDLFNIRSEEDFYTILAQCVLKETSSKWEEAIDSSKKFLSRFIPKITFSGDAQNEVSFGFDWNEIKSNPDDILDLAEKIATEKGFRMVICVDEFQNIAEFNDPVFFQKKLRSHWQKHQNVAYCLYGSKRHLLLDVFTNGSMPFYKFGTILFLEKIDTKSWIDFITERFEATGKSISGELAGLISSLAENHPYYVQQLAQQAWLRTEDSCSAEIIHAAHQSLVDQLSLLFDTITQGLTTLQLNFLKACINGEKSMNSASTLEKYGLGSSANVTRCRKSLVEKDVLDITPGKTDFQDPIYKYWLAHTYFTIV